jgi:plasmid stabilization system protein ParE
LILRLHRLAADEIKEAAEWYHAREEGLERRFLAAVRSSFERLEADPSQFASLETLPKKPSFQRVLLDEFPYLIVYEQFQSEVFVYAVAHASRRPNYWRRRKRSQS